MHRNPLGRERYATSGYNARIETFYRINSAGDDPDELLDPDNQWTTPWNDGDEPETCDKCDATGRVRHECMTCSAGAPDPGCPSCSGEVTYERECPVCHGTGKPDTEPRRGVSVFPDLDALLRYLARRDAHMEGSQIVFLEGVKSDDEDFDADEGALLVCPRRIVNCRPLRDDEIAAARAAVEH